MTSSGSGRPLRVTYLITSSGGGGAEQQVRALALAFRRRGWDVGVVSMLPLEALLLELREHDVQVATLGMSRGVPDPRALVRLSRLIRRWRPDVLHAHMVHANLLARLSRLLVPIPVVVSTIHNQDEGAQWRYVAYRLTDRLSDVTTSVSRLAVDEAVRRGAVARGRIQLVPNGIALREHGRKAVVRDTARRDLGLSDRFIWLAVGRLAEAKAYPDMVAAFRRVLDADTRAVLLIAGEGPLEPAIRSAIDSAGLQDFVRLLGWRSDVPALMQAADAFVMSSVWEGLPIVLLEASASSLPIVATDVGGSRDTIVDASSGHITPPADPAALAGAMLLVMALPEADRLAMGEVAREHVSRVFDLETVADAWDDLYRHHLPVVRR